MRSPQAWVSWVRNLDPSCSCPTLLLSLTLAGLAGLAVGHVVENVLHGAAVGQRALPHLSVGLLPPLALMCMEQQDQLLLNEFALLGVSCWAGRHASSPRNHAHRCYLLLHLRLQKGCTQIRHKWEYWTSTFYSKGLGLIYTRNEKDLM